MADSSPNFNIEVQPWIEGNGSSLGVSRCIVNEKRRIALKKRKRVRRVPFEKKQKSTVLARHLGNPGGRVDSVFTGQTTGEAWNVSLTVRRTANL